MKQYLSENEQKREQQIKRARKINAAIFIVAFITLLSMCIYYWNQLGNCTAIQLIAAVVFYSLGCGAIWFTIDQTIKEQQ